MAVRLSTSSTAQLLIAMTTPTGSSQLLKIPTRATTCRLRATVGHPDYVLVYLLRSLICDTRPHAEQREGPLTERITAHMLEPLQP